MSFIDEPPDYDSEIAKKILKTPPTYHSLFEQITSPVNEVNNQIRRAIDDPESGICCKCCSICCRTFLGILLFSIGFITPIAMIVTGAYSLKKCPLESKIPIWLLVFGLGILIMFFLQVFIKIYKDAKEYLGLSKTYRREAKIMDSNYCDKTCYLMAFWIITSIWIFLSSFCLLCLCCCLTYLIINRLHANNSHTNITDN